MSELLEPEWLMWFLCAYVVYQVIKTAIVIVVWRMFKP